MKTKEEVIKEAWINHSIANGINKIDATDEVESFIKNTLIDENGYANYGVDDIGEFGFEPFGEVERTEVKNRVYKWRPISLKGIETNNNWISIQSEKDLPSDVDFSKFKLYFFANNVIYEINDHKRHKLHMQKTHYQLVPIKIIEPPLHK